MEPLRIDVRRLLRVFLVGVFVPMCIALAIDFALGWMPFVTIAALVFVLPLGTVWVIRATLDEMNRVFQVIAPEPEEPEHESL